MRCLATSLLAFLFCLAAVPSFGQTTLDDRATLNIACPDLLTEDFESFDNPPEVGLGGLGITDAPENLSIGTMHYPSSNGVSLANFYDTTPGAIETNFVVLSIDCASLSLFAPATHFGVDYIGLDVATIEFVDADGAVVGTVNLADSDVAGNGNGVYTDDSSQFIGWVAPAGVTFSEIRFCFNDIAGGGIDNISVGTCVSETTCSDQLAAVKASIEDLLAGATGNEAYKLQGALDCITAMQNPVYWQSENRLSQYGSSFFVGGAYTIAWLDWTGNPAVDPVIADLLDTLECIVDAEIAYALANDGNSCYLYYAEAYSDVAVYLDENCDRPVISAFAFRLAWLHAFYSTY